MVLIAGVILARGLGVTDSLRLENLARLKQTIEAFCFRFTTPLNIYFRIGANSGGGWPTWYPSATIARSCSPAPRRLMTIVAGASGLDMGLG